jgi:hypothetical protein
MVADWSYRAKLWTEAGLPQAATRGPIPYFAPEGPLYQEPTALENNGLCLDLPYKPVAVSTTKHP